MSNDGVNGPADAGRRRFLGATTAVVGAVGAGFGAVPFVESMSPSVRTRLANAPVVVDIGELGEGQRLIVEWRGQPIWVVRRSKAMLDVLHGLDPKLRDPESRDADQQPAYVLAGNREYRSIRPDVSVLVGLCTHLGCSPEMMAEIRPEPFDAHWQGGYFCPCHKSRFDMSGRVYQGVPAPTNLVVPPHHYRDAHTLVIGEDPHAGHGHQEGHDHGSAA
jgi:ubiquinol-cytochrome c reductase iron-sulfur subunit